jgi:hypothetical protein
MEAMPAGPSTSTGMTAPSSAPPNGLRAAVYEEFVRAVDAGVALAPATAQGLVSGAIAPETVRATLDTQRALVSAARVYVISPEAAEVVEQAAVRLRAIPPFEPPVPCVWLEFETDQIGLSSGERVRAITVHPARQLEVSAEPEHDIRCWIAPGICAKGMITSPTSWLWNVGPCPEQAPCPLAAVRGDWLSARLALPNAEVCACAQSATRVLAYVSTLLTLLRADGVDQEEYLEEYLTAAASWPEPEPRQATAGGKGASTAGAARPQPAAGEVAPIRWVRISLSQQQPWSRPSRADGARGVVGDDEGTAEGTDDGEDRDDVHLTQVATHARLLIPGPDKPWRGDTPRIVWVRTHQRHVHGRSVARFYVEP